MTVRNPSFYTYSAGPSVLAQPSEVPKFPPCSVEFSPKSNHCHTYKKCASKSFACHTYKNKGLITPLFATHPKNRGVPPGAFCLPRPARSDGTCLDAAFRHGGCGLSGLRGSIAPASSTCFSCFVSSLRASVPSWLTFPPFPVIISPGCPARSCGSCQPHPSEKAGS
jgi:hypothetical protein